jgi:hypothetical protein
VTSAAKTAQARPLTVPDRSTASGPVAYPELTPLLEPQGRAARVLTAARAHGPRMPFVLLVLSLLGGGLICLLVINTTLAAAQFRITSLQQSNVAQQQQEQVLQQQVASEQSPSRLEALAMKLGLRPERVLRFLDLRTGRVYSQPVTVPGVTYYPPGYTP